MKDFNYLNAVVNKIIHHRLPKEHTFFLNACEHNEWFSFLKQLGTNGVYFDTLNGGADEIAHISYGGVFFRFIDLDLDSTHVWVDVIENAERMCKKCGRVEKFDTHKNVWEYCKTVIN